MVNEISLSPLIKKLISNNNIQARIKNLGFLGGLVFVEPLAGIIDRSNGGKFMLYQFVKGVRTSSIKDISGLDEILTLISRQMLDNGIRPADFNSRQMLCGETDGYKTLYILDIEGFYRINR